MQPAGTVVATVDSATQRGLRLAQSILVEENFSQQEMNRRALATGVEVAS